MSFERVEYHAGSGESSFSVIVVVDLRFVRLYDFFLCDDLDTCTDVDGVS